jgi:hypothetical protein
MFKNNLSVWNIWTNTGQNLLDKKLADNFLAEMKIPKIDSRSHQERKKSDLVFKIDYKILNMKSNDRFQTVKFLLSFPIM